MEPFYFRSYNKVVGIAHDVKELKSEIERLGKKDSACVEYHLKEGHIVNWLNYINERGLAEMLKGVSSYKEASSRIGEYLALKASTQNITKQKRTSRRRQYF
ncbi:MULTISPECIES: hypothetical protein [Acidianus]|uniref:Uncharacterized protein n=1 Tax=Candidatus Acidianus copahuensis TaxID=1160895 RepID=A0A031LU90_9CREN|nr:MULTISPECIES: hypothetical protein [Acidianus]EZQ11039.1 hypothetical protein CM19_02195 [Candidatus Acidianus copahuensis]NON62831.1 hypothetical protein [Acidianus sp. RZ1]